MRLLLIRHGPAGERDPLRWPDDRDRPLTRAQQSANVLFEEADLEHGGEPLESLIPGGSWCRTLIALESLPAESKVVAGAGEQRWFLPPRILRHIARRGRNT